MIRRILFLSCGIFINVQSQQLNTNFNICPEIQFALGSGNVEKLTNLLQDATTDELNAFFSNGMTPLTYALSFNSSNYQEIVKLLIAHNVDVNLKDKNGNTPLITAISNGNIETVPLLIKHQVDVYQLGNEMVPPLFYTTSTKIAQLLLDAGVDIKTKDLIKQKTALIHAAEWNCFPFAKFLIVSGCPLDETDILARTALMWAIICDYPKMVRLLVAWGANPNIENNLDARKRAIDFSFARKNKKIMQQAILDGKGDKVRIQNYYQQQYKLIEESQQLLPEFASIIRDYAYGEEPEDLHPEHEPIQNNSWCTIQ